MKKILVLLAVLPLCLTCEKADPFHETNVESDVPSCIQEIIYHIKQDPVWNPPAKIYRYQYNGETVYFLPQRCCDIPSLLFDSNCNIICSPDGGFGGSGDGLCPDFFEKRTHEKLIWEDKR
jgi:hypothetical protein